MRTEKQGYIALQTAERSRNVPKRSQIRISYQEKSKNLKTETPEIQNKKEIRTPKPETIGTPIKKESRELKKPAGRSPKQKIEKFKKPAGLFFTSTRQNKSGSLAATIKKTPTKKKNRSTKPSKKSTPSRINITKNYNPFHRQGSSAVKRFNKKAGNNGGSSYLSSILNRNGHLTSTADPKISKNLKSKNIDDVSYLSIKNTSAAVDKSGWLEYNKL